MSFDPRTGARQQEVSASQPDDGQRLNQGTDGQVPKDAILFNAYPRDGYPNYSYVQQRYLQNPPAISHDAADHPGHHQNIQRHGNISNMPLQASQQAARSPHITEIGADTHQTLRLNNDSASESEADLVSKMNSVENEQVQSRRAAPAFQSRLPQCGNNIKNISKSAGR